jgi:integrase
MLTLAKIKALQPKEKDYKVTDGRGLYLLVKTSGSKLWRYDYARPLTKKRATYSLGAYPDLSLVDARNMHSELRTMLAKSIDPLEHKKELAREAILAQKSIFEAVALEYIEKKSLTWAETTKINNQRYLSYASAKFGKKPISEVKAIDVLDVCRLEEKKGNYEQALKIRSVVGQVMRYAVACSYCERDVTQDLRGAIITPKASHHAAIIDPVELGKLLKGIDTYNGYLETQIALKLMPYIFVRPGELRFAQWSDIDFDERQFKFTPRKTRQITGISLVVPLSNQAFNLLKEIEPVTRHKSKYIFPAVHTVLKPMSENTMRQALMRLGYTSDEHTIHGFRATARTLLVEKLKYDEQLVEMQLGHRVRDMHGRAYNRTTFIDERTEMMQAWADYLDEIKKAT